MSCLMLRAFLMFIGKKLGLRVFTTCINELDTLYVEEELPIDASLLVKHR